MKNDIRTPKPFPVTVYHSGYHGNAQNCKFNEIKAQDVVAERFTLPGKSQHLGNTNTNALQNSEFYLFSG